MVVHDNTSDFTLSSTSVVERNEHTAIAMFSSAGVSILLYGYNMSLNTVHILVRHNIIGLNVDVVLFPAIVITWRFHPGDEYV